MGVEHGSLVLADIGGYTKYLTGVELEHSHDILADLLSVVVRTLTPSLRLAKLEGDAVFCHLEDSEGGADANTLVTLVEGCYFAFHARVRDIQFATSCTCRACSRIPDLTLKFLVHHGEYVVHDIAGHRELVGPDVVLAHRLLKNSITERTGLRGYALFTSGCMDRFGIDAARAGMTPQVEDYDDVGRVHGHLLDLERRWAEEQERAVVFLEPGAAPFEIDADIPGPPPVVWDWITAPAKRVLWQVGVTGVDQDNPAEVRGVGTINHCMHGDAAVVEEILDWKPFRYLTELSQTPIGPALCTIDLTPNDDGTATRVDYRLRPEDPELDPAVMTATGEMYGQLLRLSFDRLAELVADSMEASPA
ncbi:MAG TPA: DUF2652 domain-containing protein [Actinomycetota bacterium]|nr:DUF2652 domain-containing protein [Actinomycetota bacterium]